MTDVLPDNSQDRKDTPVCSGVLDYFPAALVEVARVSKYGNDKHNPGEPLHHARGKSMDHSDALLRHLIDRGGIDPDTGLRHSAELAWRALALLQQELEDAGAPLARGARLPEPEELPQSVMAREWGHDEFDEGELPIFDGADTTGATGLFRRTGEQRPPRPGEWMLDGWRQELVAARVEDDDDDWRFPVDILERV